MSIPTWHYGYRTTLLQLVPYSPVKLANPSFREPAVCGMQYNLDPRIKAKHLGLINHWEITLLSAVTVKNAVKTTESKPWLQTSVYPFPSKMSITSWSWCIVMSQLQSLSQMCVTEQSRRAVRQTNVPLGYTLSPTFIREHNYCGCSHSCFLALLTYLFLKYCTVMMSHSLFNYCLRWSQFVEAPKYVIFT